jgi:predicted enzyme related to lactoylglutathione lyase
VHLAAAIAVATPVSASVLTIDVPDVDAVMQQVPDAGGEPALPKTPLPGMGWLAYCKDTDGNLFGVMAEDPSAG